ncbi:MAG TPA: hypothetical protein VGO92_02450, partial [Acidimicrobiales bacterium]|nr:hypothetical protein [Acidimicrobiales bacterium]
MTAFRRQPRDPDRLELTEFDTHTNAVWDRYLTKEKPAAGKQVLGICCSGGGIRSASYNLGALQVLRQSGHLAAAKYLAAVSGGTYISAAHAAIASLSDEQVFEDGPPPWAPGSPEERH